jgi:hypothetical protein
MQKPGRLNLDCFQGATFEYSLTWTAAGVPVDLTNYDARMQVRESFNSQNPLVSLSVGSGIALGGTAGTIDLSLDAETTEAFAVIANAQFIYDLELVSSSGNVTRLIEGSFLVYPEVTR